MERATVHSIVVTNAKGEGLPLATGEVGILEYDGGVPHRLSFTPENGVTYSQEPLSITFSAPEGTPQGAFDTLAFRGVSTDNIAQFEAKERVVGEAAAAAPAPMLPGTAVVGWGFNIFGRYAESSKIRQLFDLGVPREQRFADRDFQIPANVTPDSGSAFDGTSHFYSSREEYQSSFSKKATLSGSYGAFSGEFSAQYSGVGREENEYQYLVFDANVVTWGASLTDPAPGKLLPSVTGDPDFQQLPDRFLAPQGTDPGNGQLFYRFFRKFGTHFVASVRMGGSLVYNAYVRKSHKYDESTATLKAELEYKALFLTAKAEAEATWTKVEKRWTEDRRVSVRGVGGTEQLFVSNPQFSENVQGQFDRWLHSVPLNPAPVDFSLRPISRLFSGDKARAIEQAFEAYANSRLEMTSLFLTQAGSQSEPRLHVSGLQLPFKPDDPKVGPCYWAVVLQRNTRRPVFNRAFVYNHLRYRSVADYFETIRTALAPFTDKGYVLALTTSELWVTFVPQGPLYGLLRSCGAGQKLAQMEAWSLQQDSTSHGRLAYCLIGVMGGGPATGAEALASAGQGQAQPLTCDLSKALLPESSATGETIWTPEVL
jgi:hypothetical protein